MSVSFFEMVKNLSYDARLGDEADHLELETTTWKEFIRSHMDVLAATDFFTAEVWTQGGLVTS